MTLTARFAGLQDRHGPLTMGQANMARCVRRDPPEHMNFLAIKWLPRRVTRDDVVRATELLLARHEGLRTTWEERGQHAHGSGELAIAVHETDGSPADLAQQAGDRLRAERFDLEGEFPLRMALVCRQGAPRLAVFVLPHTAVDAISLAQVLQEWDRLLLGAEIPAQPPVQPIDLAEQEHTPESRKRADATIRHWREGLDRAPQTMFPIAFDTEHALLPRLRVRSADAAAALERATRRTGASRSIIVMAAFGALLGLRTGQPSCLLASLSSNRTRPALRGHIGPLAQDALIVADLRAATFDELVRRFRVAALSGYQHSRFDSDRLWNTIDTLDEERGTRYARDCVYNDMSLQAASTGEPPPEQEAELDWLEPASLPANLSLWVNRLDESELELLLWVSPRVLARAEAERFSRGLVRLLVEAGEHIVDLADLGKLTDMTPTAYGPGWVRSEGSWVRPASVRELVESAVPGCRARVVVNDDTTLTCHLTGTDLAQEELRRLCRSGLSARADAIVPHTFVTPAPPPR
ncbi:MAG: hypothetical protein HOV86_23205 [Thermoactinospora sp.]|nr:hypothetical protein [Thermoactinospora sp.]